MPPWSWLFPGGAPGIAEVRHIAQQNPPLGELVVEDCFQAISHGGATNAGRVKQLRHKCCRSLPQIFIRSSSNSFFQFHLQDQCLCKFLPANFNVMYKLEINNANQQLEEKQTKQQLEKRQTHSSCVHFYF